MRQVWLQTNLRSGADRLPELSEALVLYGFQVGRRLHHPEPEQMRPRVAHVMIIVEIRRRGDEDVDTVRPDPPRVVQVRHRVHFYPRRPSVFRHPSLEGHDVLVHFSELALHDTEDVGLFDVGFSCPCPRSETRFVRIVRKAYHDGPERHVKQVRHPIRGFLPDEVLTGQDLLLYLRAEERHSAGKPRRRNRRRGLVQRQFFLSVLFETVERRGQHLYIVIRRPSLCLTG